MKTFHRCSVVMFLAYLATNISVHGQNTVSNTLAAVNIERGLFLEGLRVVLYIEFGHITVQPRNSSFKILIVRRKILSGRIPVCFVVCPTGQLD